MISLLLVDDHPVVRDGLRGMYTADPRFEVIGEASNGTEAIAKAAALRPDVIIMDLRMPGSDGVSAIRALAQRDIPSRILVLTTYDTDSDVVAAIEAGATGYLLKDSPREELFRATEAAAQGQTTLAPTVAARLLGRMRRPSSGNLSQREVEVLDLIARGSTNREAARRLFVSEATIKTHLLHAFAKLGVNDRAAAVAAAFSRGYLAHDHGD
ncbi:response regulator [Microbacterium sp. A84]|uniref:response regulator n=1 Tax=Microbacterium sp. A84 TaxID=3450715 RepID=UPI003F41D964